MHLNHKCPHVDLSVTSVHDSVVTDEPIMLAIALPPSLPAIASLSLLNHNCPLVKSTQLQQPASIKHLMSTNVLLLLRNGQ